MPSQYILHTQSHSKGRKTLILHREVVYTMGTSPECQVIFHEKSKQVHDVHCKLFYDVTKRKWILRRALDSCLVKVNGCEIRKMETYLKSGVSITIGDNRLYLERKKSKKRKREKAANGAIQESSSSRKHSASTVQSIANNAAAAKPAHESKSQKNSRKKRRLSAAAASAALSQSSFGTRTQNIPTHEQHCQTKESFLQDSNPSFLTHVIKDVELLQETREEMKRQLEEEIGAKLRREYQKQLEEQMHHLKQSIAKRLCSSITDLQEEVSAVMYRDPTPERDLPNGVLPSPAMDVPDSSFLPNQHNQQYHDTQFSAASPSKANLFGGNGMETPVGKALLPSPVITPAMPPPPSTQQGEQDPDRLPINLDFMPQSDLRFIFKERDLVYHPR